MFSAIFFLIFFIITVIVLSVYTWNIAKEKGYNAFFAVAINLFIPIIGFFIILSLPNNTRKKLEYGFLKYCPHCMEVIHRDARVCRACARAVDVAHDPSESFQRSVGSPADFADSHSFNVSEATDNSLGSELKNTKRDISVLVEKLKRQRKNS